MAPEQLDARAGRIDARSDVFALGAVLYELLTLRKCFPARPMHEFLDALKRGEPMFPAPSLALMLMLTWAGCDEVSCLETAHVVTCGAVQRYSHSIMM